MKRIFNLAIIMLAAMAAASCQKSVLDSENSGELVEVEFKIVTEDTMPTRAAGEATMHKELKLFVYKDGQYLDQLVTRINHFGNGYEASASAKLVKGQKYDFVFWAQATDSKYYTIDPATAVVTVDYSDLAANNDLRDAFYHYEPGVLVESGMAVKDVVLKRPFAQINVGTTQQDIDDAKIAGVNIDKTSVVMGKVADKLNLFTGIASGEVDVTFKPAAMPAEPLVVYKGTADETSYVYLSLNYILVGDGVTPGEKDVLENYDITFYQGTKAINKIDVPNVPVRRNWRTNIIGENILTDYASFKIIIDPDFYGEYVHDYEGGSTEEIVYPDNQ